MMASQSSRPAGRVSSIPQRARRIPDEEWEIWKEKLVKLFIEDDVPRKEIIATMAEEHHFIVTEVQLKNRFKKWDVKKYIPDDDLRLMLSLKRKRQRVGKDARFQYKGHDVEQERMERAWKRQKGPLPSPELVPPYIKMYTSRQHSPQDAGASLDSAGCHATGPQNFDMPLLELNHTRGSPRIPFHNPFECEFDYDSDTPLAVQNLDDYGVIHPGQSSGELVMAEAPVTASLRFEETGLWGDVIPSSDMQIEHSGISRVLQDDGSREHLSTIQLSRASSHVSSVDWGEYFNFSPSVHSSSGAPNMAFRSPRHLSRPSSTITDRTQSSSRAFLGDNLVRISPRRQGSRSMTSQQTDGRVTFPTFNVMNPESIMPLLQLLKSNLIELARGNWSTLGNRFTQGSKLDHLYSTLHSNWLSLDIEELICRGYELSAQAIRRRQAARPVSRDGNNLLLTLEDDRECEASKTGRQLIEDRDSKTRLRLKHTCRTTRSTSMGRLNVECGTPRQQSPYADSSDVPYVVKISFIPKSHERTMGISAVFQNYSSAPQWCRISPSLRTFNVIPGDSQIIDCIRKKDLSGVQRLFTEGKASPSDVDSSGFSLLSYAMPWGNPDIFRLLLEGGAGTQNCSSYGKTVNVIWAIWIKLIDNSDTGGISLDFDVGTSLTRLALEHGCDIEETAAFNGLYPNLLFDVNYYRWTDDHPMVPIETLVFLLNIGYDLEQQSSVGLTALLFAATRHEHHTIKCLRLFIERGANLHAIDFEGRGVLHCALAAPHIYVDWSSTLDPLWMDWMDSRDSMDSMDSMDKSNCSTVEANYTAWLLFDTEDNRHKEDYDDEGVNPGRLLDDKIDNSCHRADEYSIDYIFCVDMEYGGLMKIRNPMQVLKKRTMFKVLTLLQLGCDPNVVDHKGLSPSDYAMRDGLWPQWRWALLNAGFIHHRQNGWVRSS